MYTIYADGELLYSTDATDEAHIALNVKLTQDGSGYGSLTFMLPPGNAKHEGLQKLKTVITMKHDDELIFRGRVLDEERDMYNQKNVYCEGEKAFLIDSQQAPYKYEGTVLGLFHQLINKHNARVDEFKRFEPGKVMVVDEAQKVEVESDQYSDTYSEIESRLLNAYGGYLVVSETTDGKRQLDLVKDYGDNYGQSIEFAVNLLDLKERISAEDVFTVLIPLGAAQINNDGEFDTPLTVASVNNGKDYIQDDDAVALYGRIERTYTWDHVTDAAGLLERGREYLRNGVAVQTLTIKAVDMHFLDDSQKAIRLLDRVHIVSDPHGIDLTMVCTKIVLDPLNPENTQYTFGEKPRTLTENVVNHDNNLGKLSGGGGHASVQEEAKAILRWAEVAVNAAQAEIRLLAFDINELSGRTSAAEIRMDGIEAEIALKASKTVVDELLDSVYSAEATLEIHSNQISSKVEVNGVISSINQTAETITIQANRIDLSGYVTASQLSAQIANLNLSISNTVSTDTLRANSAIVSYMTYNSKYCTWKSMTVNTPNGEATINYIGHN